MLKMAFKISPAEADEYEKLAATNPVAFAATKTLREKLEVRSDLISQRLIDGEDALVTYGEGGHPVARFEKAIETYQAENKVSYGVAMKAVSKEHPDLARAYRSANTGAGV